MCRSATDSSSAKTSRASAIVSRQVFTERRPEQGQRRRGESRLHDRPLIDVIEDDDPVGEFGDRRAGCRDDRDRVGTAGPELGEHVDAFGGRAGATEDEHLVVAATGGNSLAANASVSPWPAASRRTA